MAHTNFKPQIWSDKIERELENGLIFGRLASRTYEGEIRKCGDVVRVQKVGASTVKTYVPGTDIAFETPTGTEQIIKIDQMDYVALTFDDVDAVQALPDLMNQQLADASYRMADKIDKALGELVTKIADGTIIKDVKIVNGQKTFLKAITKLSALLKKHNVPTQGRWLVISPEVEEQLLNELDGTNIPQTADAALINGYVGRVRGFDIYTSNNVKVAGNVHHTMGGVSRGLQFISQLQKIQAGDHEKTFGEYVKMLALYGLDVLETEKAASGSFARTTLLGSIQFDVTEPVKTK